MEITTKNLWEEKDLIERTRNSLNKTEFELTDIINNTKRKLSLKECEDIGKKKKWKKVCPNCKNESFYVSEENLNKSVKNNRSCLKCGSFKNDRYLGMKFGTLTITKQYNAISPCHSKIVKVDYKCDCGYVGINKRFGCIKRQKMCLQCKKKNKFKILPNGETSFNLLYSSYIKSAKIRGLEFKLTKDEFRRMTKQKCFYCGTAPTTIIKPNSPGGGYTYNGIDRKDSNKGYIMDNSVTCCKICNYSKMKLSVDDFLNHVRQIYEYQFIENKQ